MRFLISILILTVLMGPLGLEGLSELSGLTIIAGHYEFQGDMDVVTIRATGIGRGITWEVLVLWIWGMPQYLAVRPLMTEM